ncbi:MAG: DUF2188 domain-containing protein [Acidimicrobiales bacterium]
MTWVVEPNVVGGWDVRAADQQARTSRHPGRDDAVTAARALGGTVVVQGMRGEVLATYDDPQETEAEAAPVAPAAPAPTPPAPPRPPSGSGDARRPGLKIAQLLTLTDQTDATGRLLLEDSAPPAAIRRAEKAGVAMETVTCAYADTPSRVGGQMNQSAYEALRHDVADILNGFAWLAERHRAAEPQATGTPERLFAVSYAGINLAHVLFHRAVDPVPPHGHLPAYVASIFKASRGIFSFAAQLENQRGPSAEMTAAEVMQVAEAERQFVRPTTGRVCAAPTRLIERTIAAILTGGEADAAKSRLGELVDFDVLWRFTQLQDVFGEALSTYRVVLEQVSAAGLANDPKRLFRHVLPDGPAQGQSFGAYTESVLATVNGVQADLNRLLGRATNAKALTFEDILRLL